MPENAAELNCWPAIHSFFCFALTDRSFLSSSKGACLQDTKLLAKMLMKFHRFHLPSIIKKEKFKNEIKRNRNFKNIARGERRERTTTTTTTTGY